MVHGEHGGNWVAQDLNCSCKRLGRGRSRTMTLTFIVTLKSDSWFIWAGQNDISLRQIDISHRSLAREAARKSTACTARVDRIVMVRSLESSYHHLWLTSTCNGPQYPQFEETSSTFSCMAISNWSGCRILRLRTVCSAPLLIEGRHQRPEILLFRC